MSSASRRIVSRVLAEISEAARRAHRLARVEDRFALVLAVLNRGLEEEGLGRIIVVGGFALELLVGGAMRTLDIDIVVEGYEAAHVVEEVLRRLGRGAEASARGPILPLGDAEKAIDLVATTYRAEFPPIRVTVPGAGWFYIEAPEQLTIHYLREWLYRGSKEAKHRVILLVGVLGETMNIAKLRENLAKEDKKLLERLDEAITLLRRHGITIEQAGSEQEKD